MMKLLILIPLFLCGCAAQPPTVAREGVFCGQGTVLRGSVCVATQPPVTCGQGTVLRGNECVAVQTQPRISDATIRKMMIETSLRGYSGNCPCPYNRASNGSQCGGRSAYSRPGGASPLCYDTDISDAMVDDYRRRLGR